MPFVRISLRAGKPTAYKRALADQVYNALRDAYAVPEDDRFVTISEHGPDEFSYGRSYLNIARTDDLVIIQITASATRDVETKKKFFARLTERLIEDPGLRPEDVFINIVETKTENWSFGLGRAQYAEAG